MNKNEKFCNPSLNLKKAKNMYPSNFNFRLIPKFIPSLEKFVKRVEWNSVSKTLEVNILETPHFEAFAWFGTINDRYAESQKSSFVDLEQDSLCLHFLDVEKKDVACFKFKNLKLLSHESILSDCNDPLNGDEFIEGIDDHLDHLCHKILIQYSELKLLAIQHEEAEIAANKNPQEAIDEEWQTMNVNGI